MERIRKGDEVIVITGKDKGKRGVVLDRVGDSHLMVEGINVVKKHTRPNPMKNVTGGIVDKTMSIDRSNVMLFDPATGKGGRIQIKESDGKRLRGSARGGRQGVHLLAAFSERLKGVIGQLQVAPDANEITAALDLLKTLPIKGAVITGDAIFAQKAICRAIIDGGGDYFFTVKSNQPALKSDIALAFGPDSPLGGVVAGA